MKNLYIKIAYLSIFCFTLICSCSKELNTNPDTFRIEIKTFEDVKSVLYGSYGGFQSSNYYENKAASGDASGWSALPDLMGDDFVEIIGTLGNWKEMSEMEYDSENGAVAGIFSQPYLIIARVNILLKFLPAYEQGATKNEAMRIKAQALAIRAHAHFDLMRYIAPDFGRNSSSLGIPYVTTFDPDKPLAYKPARNTVKECYDNIYADLNSSLQAFRAGGNTTANGSRYFIDSTVVYAMRTRVNYYASQWSDAIKDANVALAIRPLTNASGYVDAFAATSETAPSTEVYWAIPSDNFLRPGLATNGNTSTYRVAADLVATIKNLGGAYSDPGIMAFNIPGGGNTLKSALYKYPAINSFKVFRAGEMMLIRAEAKQKLGDITALDDLNNLRTNRGVATGTETGAALLDAITLLRRVELLGEGHRWFDIKRTTKTINRAECGDAGNSSSDKCSIAADSKKWAFPIPFSDAKANPNLVPNPGY